MSNFIGIIAFAIFVIIIMASIDIARVIDSLAF